MHFNFDKTILFTCPSIDATIQMGANVVETSDQVKDLLHIFHTFMEFPRSKAHESCS